MASCHSSRELGSHGRSCQFDWGSFHARALRGVRDHGGSGELRGFHGLAAIPAMNRFNGLCKVCSERRYRQVCIPPATNPRASVWLQALDRFLSVWEFSCCGWALWVLLVRHRLDTVIICKL